MSVSIEKRLKSVIPEGNTQSDFATAIEVKLPTLKAWLKGTNAPNADALSKISQFTGVDLNWLITGKNFHSTSKPDKVFIKCYDVQASAGAGTVINDEQQIEPIGFDKHWLRSHIGVLPRNLSIIEAKGDSMEPTIRSGSIVLVDHSVNSIEADGIYVLIMDNELYVKRVQRILGTKLVIKSDNTAYDQYTIDDPKDIGLEIKGRVRWVGNSF